MNVINKADTSTFCVHDVPLFMNKKMTVFSVLRIRQSNNIKIAVPIQMEEDCSFYTSAFPFDGFLFLE